MACAVQLFTPWLSRWHLIRDGEPFSSLNGHLLPVLHRGEPAMLKISRAAEEQAGAALMAWWDGNGAAPVLAHEGEALLMARAMGSTTLAEKVEHDDPTATSILCSVVQRLHATRSIAAPALVPLQTWFASLLESNLGGLFEHSAASARDLLTTQTDLVVLHGDIHHGNVLDFGESGWLAIDPKGLWGERGFDYANLFCNPGAEALRPGRFERRLEIVTKATGLERRRLLQWILAWAGLSACWMLEDGAQPGHILDVAALAQAMLAQN